MIWRPRTLPTAGRTRRETKPWLIGPINASRKMGHELCKFGASAEVQDVRTIHVRMRTALKKLMRGPRIYEVSGAGPSAK